MSDKNKTLFITGKAISPGLAEGKTFLYRDTLRSLDAPVAIGTEDVEEEFQQLEDATEMISEDLLALATRVEEEMDSKLASAFEAHELMLNDPSLKAELQAFARAVIDDAPVAVAPEDALAALCCAVAMVESGKKQIPINIEYWKTPKPCMQV